VGQRLAESGERVRLSTLLADQKRYPLGCADLCSESLQLGAERPTVGIDLPTRILGALHAPAD